LGIRSRSINMELKSLTQGFLHMGSR